MENKPQRGTSEDERCPSNDYTVGDPKGTCWGDGHYDCKNCKHYREDFKRHGQVYIDYIHELNRERIYMSIMDSKDIYS